MLKNKSYYTLGLGLISLIITGCSAGNVRPEETKIDGDLAGAFKIIDEEYPIQKDGNESSFTIKIQRTKVSVPYTPDLVCPLGKEADDEMMVQGGFGYILFDAKGKEIEEVAASDNEAFKQVKQILSLNPGENGELTISFDSNLKPAYVKLTSKAKILGSGPLKFYGAIGKYPVKNFEADFNFAKGEEKGKYQYQTSSNGSFLFFKGTNESYSLTSKEKIWKISMTETTENGDWCGAYEGTVTLLRDDTTSPYYYRMEGKFTNFRFDTYSFSINSKPIGEKSTED